MRIRNIRPEFWTSRKLARDLTLLQRLFYIALWNEADDQGRFRSDPLLLSSRCFPFDPEIDEQFAAETLRRLQETGRVTLYEVSGESYGHVRKFHKHQRPNRPTPSRLPPPPDDRAAAPGPNRESQPPAQMLLSEVHYGLTEGSLSPHGALSEPSVGFSCRDQEVGSRDQGSSSSPPPRARPSHGDNAPTSSPGDVGEARRDQSGLESPLPASRATADQAAPSPSPLPVGVPEQQRSGRSERSTRTQPPRPHPRTPSPPSSGALTPELRSRLEAVRQTWQDVLVPAGAPAAPDLRDWSSETLATVEARLTACGPDGVREALLRASRSSFLVLRARVPLSLPRLFGPLWEGLQAGTHDDRQGQARAGGDRIRLAEFWDLPAASRESIGQVAYALSEDELRTVVESERMRLSSSASAGGAP